MTDQMQQLQKAREKFYGSLKDQRGIDSAIAAFEEIAETKPALHARAIIYKGALIGLKAKNAFWPHEKLAFVNQGLKMIDEGLEKNPEDLESRFIHGTACHYLPGFLGRGNDAKADFDLIIKRLPDHHQKYDSELIVDMILFMEEHAELDEEAAQTLADIKMKYV